MLSTVIVGIFISFIVYVYYKYKFSYWKSRSIPHEAPTFIFGNILDILYANDPIGRYVGKLFEKYDSDYVGFYGLTKPILFTKNLNLIKNVLTKQFNAFSNRHIAYNPQIESVISGSLFGIRSPQWTELRKLLSPVFTSGKIKMMMNLFMECGQNLENYLGSMNDKTLDMKEVAAKYTIDVISSCAFGMDTNSFLTKYSEIEKYGRKLFPNSISRSLKKISYVFAPTLTTILRYSFFDPEATNYFKKLLMEVIHLRKKSKLKRDDLVDILLKTERQSKECDFNLDEDKLVAQAIIFFGAGFETTSSTIAFTLHELSNNSHIQNRLRKEIKTEIAKHGNLTYEAVQSMEYLHMVISETLRKYPLTSFINRECTEEFRIDETGVVIEKGTPVFIPQYSLHWDPRYFPNPEIYNPERFSQENIHNITEFTYLPFGLGPRKCIGDRFAMLSAKLAIIYSVKNFYLENDLKNEKDIKYTRTLLLQPKNGIWLKCIKV